MTAIVAVLGCSAARPPDLPKTLFERLGGLPTLQQWVDDLAWRLAADPRLGDSFARADISQLKARMLRMTCSITGGSCEYDAKTLEKAHRGLALTGEDIERFLTVAGDSATAVGVPEKPRLELIERLRVIGGRLGQNADRVGSDP